MPAKYGITRAVNGAAQYAGKDVPAAIYIVLPPHVHNGIRIPTANPTG